ncbi:MAG: hypothetical protein WD206_05115 [Actinomycetota bacterium]
MLQVTDTAAAVFRDILASEGVEGNAIRLTPQPAENGQTSISLQPVEGPGIEDASTEAKNVDVYVAPELAPALSDAVLDAEPLETGARFFVRDRA